MRGTIERVRYRSEEDGFAVFDLRSDAGGHTVTVVGTCPEGLGPREQVEVLGRFTEHARFGRRLSASVVSLIVPSSPDALKKYLSSGAVRGIGAGTAERIVSALGERSLQVLYNEPHAVGEIPGVGAHKAELLARAFAGRTAAQEVARFLVGHGVSPGLARKIHVRYGDRAMEVLTRDPYVLARDLQGIGFRKADAIASALGVPPDAPQRLRAGVLHSLTAAENDGDLCVAAEVLVPRAAALLGVPAEGVARALTELVDAAAVLVRGDDLYLPRLYRAEEMVGRFVGSRAREDAPFIGDDVVAASLAEAEETLGVTFSEEQRAAVAGAARRRFMLVTGGPGCGKTTLVRALAVLYRRAGLTLALAAPTGRAAQRLSHVCGRPASTIHRLLRFSRGAFFHGPDEPVPADALIVDEASMIDVPLAAALFSAVPYGAPVILVGDKDQLPSVGPGRLFADLVEADDVVRTVRLTRLYRRSEESAITTAAHSLNGGVPPDVPEPDGETKSDAYFLARADPVAAVRTVENLVADQLPRKFGAGGGDVSVLTPSNRGPLGTVALNAALQERLNPLGDRGPESEITVGDVTFRAGDKVCQRVNNYSIDDTGVFNGDTGTVTEVDRKAESLSVELWDGRRVKYSGKDLSQLSLGYAVTVHRAQGTEVPCVVLVLHDTHYNLLERQLVYTAFTRAKRLLVVVGTRRAIGLAAERTRAAGRRSRLTSVVRETAGL